MIEQHYNHYEGYYRSNIKSRLGKYTTLGNKRIKNERLDIVFVDLLMFLATLDGEYIKI